MLKDDCRDRLWMTYMNKMQLVSSLEMVAGIFDDTERKSHGNQ